LIRILNAEPAEYSNNAQRILKSIGELDELYLSRDELLNYINDYEVLIVRLGFQVDRELIDAGQNLRVIVTPTTGLDHIDLAYANKQGIDVLSLKGETDFLDSIPATAEHTWALLLALVRSIPWAYQSVLNSEWDRDSFRGNDLKGRELGIVGFGRIGKKIARYGMAFEMKVGMYDPYLSNFLPSGITRFYNLYDLLNQAEIVSLHVPLNQETVGLINNQEFRNMKAGSLLINTSRGALLDEGALLRALEHGPLGGAALDVLCNENNLSEGATNPIIEYSKTHTNLIITPHLGGATHESMGATEVFMAKKLKAFLDNR